MEFTAENILLIGSVLLFWVVGMLFGSDGLGLQFQNAKEAQFMGIGASFILGSFLVQFLVGAVAGYF